MRAFYRGRFMLPLPVGHRFMVQKYYLLRERVQAELPDVELDQAPVATDSEWARVYGRAFIRPMTSSASRTAAPNAREPREIGFPWSVEMAYTSPSAMLLYLVPPPGEIRLLRERWPVVTAAVSTSPSIFISRRFNLPPLPAPPDAAQRCRARTFRRNSFETV